MTALAFIVAVVLFTGAAALVPDRLPRLLRLLVIAAVPVTALAVWLAVRAYEGWPLATSTPPIGASFIAADVHEPNWIYLWLTPRSSSKPRAYRVRYDEHLYAQVLKAEQQVQHGGTVRIAQRRAQPGRRGKAAAGVRLASFELRSYHEPAVRPPVKQHGRAPLARVSRRPRAAAISGRQGA